MVEVENSKETIDEGKFRETTEGFKVRSEPAVGDIADIPDREYSDTGDTQSSDGHEDVLCDDASGRRSRPKVTWTEQKPARKKKFALSRFKKKSDNGQNIIVTRNKANTARSAQRDPPQTCA